VSGRDELLGVVGAGVDDALAGRGRLFVIVGPTGSGKTRLADEVASTAKEHGARILWGRGWDGGGAPAFWPWSQALRDAGQTLEPPEPADAEARFRFFETVTESLRAEAARQPLLIVFDDLQAADDDSIVLLEFVATELPEMSALVLALGRPETARLDELGRHATRTLEL
jgi:predicted ATPase